MKRDLIIKLALDEAEVELFRNRMAFIAPLSPQEAARLGTDVIFTHEGCEALAASLVAFAEGRDFYGKPDPELTKALGEFASMARDFQARMDRVRQIIGRGKFVGEGGTEQKGPMQ
ncbi:MAG: hypothetical protein IPL38_00230 [Rhodobacter sp.]|jgi:hypothetical protein|nr:hypothetical protein [Rhodobacter sp.]